MEATTPNIALYITTNKYYIRLTNLRAMKSGLIRMVKTYVFVGMAMFLPVTLLADKLDSLEALLKSEVRDSTYIEVQLQLSKLYHFQEKHGDRCIQLANDAVKNAMDVGDTFLYAKALDNLGLLYRYHQHYAQAFPLHKKAYDLTEATDIPPLSKMIFANNTGVAARHNGNFDVAIEYYLKALAIAERENNQKNQEIASNGLGIAIMNLPGREEEALAYLERALQIAISSGNKLGQAMNYLSIGGYYDDIGQHNRAREYLYKLERLNEEMGDRNGIAITFEAIGNSFFLENKNLPLAKTYFERSLLIYEQLENDLGQARVHCSIGNILQQNGRFDEALIAYFQAFEVGNNLENYSMIQGSAALISQFYEAQGDAKNALAYYRIEQQYKDSLAFHEQEVAISAIKHQYDFESKEAQIQLLTKDKQLSEAKLQRGNMTIFVMSVLLIILIGIGFFQTRFTRIKRRTEELVKRQKEARMKALYEKNLMEAEIIATRMQINPHFMFNCLGSIKFLVERTENDKALNYLVNFSRFTRRVLEISRRPVHTVAEEFKLLDEYLKLEKNRFDNDFNYRIVNNMCRWDERNVIPALLLQPFVENAICHGLAPSSRAEKILLITATCAASHIQINIEDNGVGLVKSDEEIASHKSMGHEITDKRVNLFNMSYQDHIQWRIENRLDADGMVVGACVEVSILIVDPPHNGLEPAHPTSTTYLTSK